MEMATTTVSDFVIWTKHIYGDAALAARLSELGAGEVLNLRIDGVEGAWRKMDDGKDGRPTPGLRPLGNAQEFWRELYKSRRGEMVELVLVDADSLSGRPGFSTQAAIDAAARLVRTDAERTAALEGFLSLAGQGWRSDAPYGSRDDLHDR
jgi:hypothetical protein